MADKFSGKYKLKSADKCKEFYKAIGKIVQKLLVILRLMLMFMHFKDSVEVERYIFL